MPKMGQCSPRAAGCQLLGKALLVDPVKDEDEEAGGGIRAWHRPLPCLPAYSPTHLCPFARRQKHSSRASRPQRMKAPPPMMPANSGRGSTIQGMLVLGSGGREGRENVAMTPLSWMAGDLPQTGPLGGETPLSSAQVSDAKSRTETTWGGWGDHLPSKSPKEQAELGFLDLQNRATP